MTEREIKRLERKVYKCESELNGALSQLANAASSVLGYEVIADYCHGDEIEFRVVDDNDMADSETCITMEDVLTKINR